MKSRQEAQVRQVMNVFNTHNRYKMALAQTLYFCSLAYHRGASTLIVDSADEETVTEDMLDGLTKTRGS